jgi:Zn-finger nucleic acid-binding protein
LATLHCDHCGEKTFAQKLIFKNAKERFIWKTRKQARAGGWRHLSLKKDRYQDYCPACAGVRMNSGEHRDLLRLVWRTSTVRVAAEMGLSDKALEKRCKRAHVPKPPRGFWAKYDAGYFASCRALIPPEVQAELGQAYLDEYYPV